MKKIKFLHLADLHLFSGAYKKFGVDGFALLHEIIEQANTDDIDLIFIAGDIFHSLPSISNLARLNSTLAGFRGQTFIILGNHDYLSPLSRFGSFDWALNIHIFDNKNITSNYLPDLNIRVWAKSYDTNQIEEALYNEYFLEDTLNKKEINVLLAHGGDELHIPTNFKKLESAGFNYVAFGHLHTYQSVAKNIVYSGSLIPQNILEEGPHGYVRGSLTTEETLYELVATSPRYQTIEVDISNFLNIEEIYIHLKEILQQNTHYILRLVGRRFFDINLGDDHLYNAGNIEDIIDATSLDIDYNELRKNNEKNILGVFIQQMQQSDNPLATKALELGVSAFLEAKDDVN